MTSDPIVAAVDAFDRHRVAFERLAGVIPVVRYSRDRLPLRDGPGALPPSEWPEWCLTSEPDAPAFPAVRIVGAFEVDVDGQVTECADGWLALDEDGSPFAIPTDEFRRYGRWHPEPEEH